MHYRPRFFSLLVVASLLGACSSSPISRIDANRELYESWPLDIQQAVLEGRVEKGMTPDMVEMILGKPTEITTRATRRGEEEVWTWVKGGGVSDLGGTTVSIGSGGGIGLGGSGGMGIPPMGGGSSSRNVGESREVIFQNGKVVRGDDVKQP